MDAQFSGIFFGLLALLVMSAFIKLFTCLNVIRLGVGLSGSGFSLVSGALALALSCVAMMPYLGETGSLALFDGTITDRKELEGRLRPFLDRHADPSLVARFQMITKKQTTGSAGAQASSNEKPAFGILVGAFVVSEIQDALKIAVLVLIPFLIVDLITVHILMLLGVTSISAAVVSLPLKLLLLMAIDGWTRISERLLVGYFT